MIFVPHVAKRPLCDVIDTHSPNGVNGLILRDTDLLPSIHFARKGVRRRDRYLFEITIKNRSEEFETASVPQNGMFIHSAGRPRL